MKQRALTVILLGAIALLVAAFASPDSAVAQPQPTMVLTPASGPCDGTVQVSGSGFQPGRAVPLDLARPHSGDVMGSLAIATADQDGRFSVRFVLGDLGCEAASFDVRLDSPGSPKEIEIYAGYDPNVLFVAARARYAYTSTERTVAPPRALPTTGTGPTASSRSAFLIPASIVLAAAGTIMAATGLWDKASKRRRQGP